ncbi:MAG: helix-turn-helix transcriptional regulator [Victivallales bacterium]|nr:helix-turn-helix transcriptional regulator [Victivallales bacterium]
MQLFKTRLRELMTERGMTQHALAMRLNIEDATLSKYLNENRLPRIDIIANMATVLNTTTDYLLGRDESKEFNYHGVKRLLARNADHMSKEEKMKLIDILFKE